MPRKPTNRVRVYVIDSDREHLRLRYRDPATGKSHYRTSGTTSKREAEKLAAVWEADINAKRWVPGERMAWSVFVDHYEKLVLPGLASTTQDSYASNIAAFTRIAAPAYLDSVTPVMLAEYAAALRSQPIVSPVQKLRRKRSETTIKGHLTVLKTALTWAHDQGWLDSVPKTPSIARARKAKKSPHKGRAITDNEFRLMLDCVPVVIKSAEHVARVRRLLWLIRLTGFRLSEAIDFWWSDHPQKNHVVIDHRNRPSIVLYSGEHKANEDETLPVTRECGEWLLSTPPDARRGRVAPLPGRLGNWRLDYVSKKVEAIGRAANIIVEPRGGKFASAHDIRRLCITDWLRRFTPAVVQKLARHSDIATTMSFYAFLADEQTADDLWNEAGSNLGSTD